MLKGSKEDVSMLNQFLDYICEEHLIAEGQQVLLAVSGGRDSVVMTDLMSQSGFAFAIAHCNFHLRPDDCDRDERFVRNLAKRYGVPCFVAHFDTEDYARAKGLSIEEAARNLRYDFFEEVRSREGYDGIATAHHRDDSVETFFINLIRGTGIAGLHGIQPRNGRVIRPMLCFDRETIDRYVQEHAIAYVEDETNAQPLYLRNKIRLQLLPLLRTLSPSFDATMQSNMHRLQEAEQVYRYAVERMMRELVQITSECEWIDILELRRQVAPATLLFEWLRPYGFTSITTAQIFNALEGQSGLHFFSSTHKVLKDRDKLMLFPLPQATELTDYNRHFTIDPQMHQLSEPVPLLFELLPAGDRVLKMPRSSACFDYDKLQFPLYLRHWHKGDRFQPFGMKGTRLLSDLFTDAKLNREEKTRIWLLCDAVDRILWVVGLRASAMAAVTPQSQRVFRVTLKDS